MRDPRRVDTGTEFAPQPPVRFSAATKEAIASGIQLAADRHDDCVDAGHLVLALLSAQPSTMPDLLKRADMEKIRSRAESELSSASLRAYPGRGVM